MRIFCAFVAWIERFLRKPGSFRATFIRTPRLITMTDIGKKYYAQCKKVLQEYKISNLLIEDKNSHLSGTLNIVCMREVAQKLVYPSMANFLEQYPHIVTNVAKFIG